MAEPIYIQVTTPIPVEVKTPAIGIQGLSAYRIAVINGFIGTEEQWLASLQSTVPGPQGEKGDTGSDANVTTVNIQAALGFAPQPAGDYILRNLSIAMAVAL